MRGLRSWQPMQHFSNRWLRFGRGQCTRGQVGAHQRMDRLRDKSPVLGCLQKKNASGWVMEAQVVNCLTPTYQKSPAPRVVHTLSCFITITFLKSQSSFTSALPAGVAHLMYSQWFLGFAGRPQCLRCPALTDRSRKEEPPRSDRSRTSIRPNTILT